LRFHNPPETDTTASRGFRDQVHGQTGGPAIFPNEVYGGRILEADPVLSIGYSRLPDGYPAKQSRKGEDDTERDPLPRFPLGKIHGRLSAAASISEVLW
jgi:hypothetical protein